MIMTFEVHQYIHIQKIAKLNQEVTIKIDFL